VVSVFLYLLYFPSYDVINDVIMSDADCTPGREPPSVAAGINYIYLLTYKKLSYCRVQTDRGSEEPQQEIAFNMFSVGEINLNATQDHQKCRYSTGHNTTSY